MNRTIIFGYPVECLLALWCVHNQASTNLYYPGFIAEAESLKLIYKDGEWSYFSSPLGEDVIYRIRVELRGEKPERSRTPIRTPVGEIKTTFQPSDRFMD